MKLERAWSAWLLALSLPILTTAAAGAQSAAVSADVRDRVTRTGNARVIVELVLSTGPHVPEGALRSAAAVSAQRREIAAARSRVLARLQATAHRVVRAYQTVPLLTLEIGPEALRALEASRRDVRRVFEDSLKKPSLAQSAPLVEASQAWTQGLDGAGTAIAVLDSGVDTTHPFLGGRVVAEACFSSTVGNRSDTLCPNGEDEQIGSGAGVNCTFFGCEHGTHVAGIAAGDGVPAGQAFSGVARGAGIVPVQVFSVFDGLADCGGLPPCIAAWDSDIVAALEHVYTLRSTFNLVAVNLSLGGGSFSSTCDEEPYRPIIDNLRSVGIATVAAAGNDGTLDALASPACVSSAVSVGSTTKSDDVSYFSNVAPFLSLFAPGDGIKSSVPGGGFAVFSGTSMAAPHVTGAWALLRQAAPAATVDELLAVLQQSGVPINDTRGGTGTTKPRIRVLQALSALFPDIPRISSVSPGQGTQGATLTVTVDGMNFLEGAALSFGTGIVVTRTTVDSSTQLTADLTIATNADVGTRDVTVTNPGGQSTTTAGGFRVVPMPPTIALSYSGKLRDRVRQSNTVLSADGALDGTFIVTVQASNGLSRTVTRLDLRRSDGAGIWDTAPETSYWALGATSGLDSALLNSSTGTVSFPVAEGESFALFVADTSAGLFVPGTTFRVTASFADGTTATTSTTLPVPPPAAITLTYLGKLRDKVRRSNTTLSGDGLLDGTFGVTLQTAGGLNRTVIGLDLRRSDKAGIWDTAPGTSYWALGATGNLDSELLNSSTGTVAFPVAEGGSFNLFAADPSTSVFVPGAVFTLTASFADGTTATASTTLPVPPPASPATLTLSYLGKLRDKVRRSNTTLSGDGLLDGTFTVTLQTADGQSRTVTSLDLRRSDKAGIWDTAPGTSYWALGVTTDLNSPLLNSSTGTVNFPVAEGGSFNLFAADSSTSLFVAGTTFTLTARFADGSTAVTTIEQ